MNEFLAYFRFSGPFIALVYTLWLFVTGSVDMTWLLLGIVPVILLLEATLGESHDVHPYRHQGVFVAAMYVFVGATLLLFTLFVWMLAYGYRGIDLLWLGRGVEALTGFDMRAAHADDDWTNYLAAALAVAVLNGFSAIGLGHELGHRTGDTVAHAISRFAGVTCGFTYYAIEHPLGHHETVGTPYDSSTALRGESVYGYFLRTSKHDYTAAWEIESERMRRLGKPVIHWQNRLLQGWAGEAALALAIVLVAGPMGLMWVLLAALGTHFAYKAGTYPQHYGITRVPGSTVKAHHAWDPAHRFDFWLSLGTVRHANHHVNGELEYWKLALQERGARMRLGFIASILLGLIPPLWHRYATPLVIEWDERLASPEERKIAAEHSERTGRPAFVAHAARLRQQAGDDTDAGEMALA